MTPVLAARTQLTPWGNIAYCVAGEGPAIVLLHPIGMDRSWWMPYVQHWSPKYRVIAIDLPGHGESALIQGSVTLSDHARAVTAIIEAESAAPVVVMGVSMGGMVAQNVALTAPDHVRALVLCATAGSFPEAARAAIRSRGDTSRRGEMADVIESTLARWFVPDSPPDLVQKCGARLASTDWHSWSANWEAISELDNLRLLSELTVPAVVLAGDQDASIPVAVSRQLAAALRADLVVMENSGHFGAFDTPHRFTPVIDQFLDAIKMPAASDLEAHPGQAFSPLP